MALLKKDDTLLRLQSENERLKKSVEELKILNELAKVISSTMSLTGIMDKLVAKAVKAIDAKQGTIHLLDKDSLLDDPFKTFIRKADESSPSSKFRLDAELSGWMMRNMEPLLVNDFENNELFINKRATDFKIQSLLSAPLVCKGQLIGVLNLFNKKGSGKFSETDKRLLAIIALQSAQVIENARLYEQEKHLLQKEQELGMARIVQTRLLPKDSPEIKGFDVAGASYAAKEVGGDYFDFIELPDGRWCVALGDVSGKGVPASLLMSHLQATIRIQVSQNEKFSNSIAKSNDFLYHNTEDNKFATFFGGILDSDKKSMTYVNAGHNFPFHLGARDKIQQLETGGLVMGMVPGCAYEEASVAFKKGDVLVIYSDGVTEAENPREEMFGEAKLKELLVKHKSKSAKELVQEIYNEVKGFEGASEQDDDITVVVVKAV